MAKNYPMQPALPEGFTCDDVVARLKPLESGTATHVTLDTERIGTGSRETWVDTVNLWYHETAVVTVIPELSQVILNTGGWRTATTKKRMNDALNALGIRAGVYKEKGEWFVGTHESSKPFYGRASSIDMKTLIPA